MASEGPSPDQTTEVVDVKISVPAGNVEQETVSHIDHDSRQPEITIGKHKDAEPEGPSIATSETEVTSGDKKIDVEIVQSHKSTIEEAKSDDCRSKPLEGSEVGTEKETSAVAITMQKESEEKIGEMHAEGTEISESKPETVLNSEPEKCTEAIVEDKIATAPETEATSGLVPKEPDVSSNENPDIRSKESIDESFDTKEITNKNAPLEAPVVDASKEHESMENNPDVLPSEVESPLIAEADPTDVSRNENLEIKSKEWIDESLDIREVAEEIKNAPLEAPVVDASKADESVENKPDVLPAEVEPPLIAETAISEQFLPEKDDILENKSHVSDIENSVSEISELPLETPEEQSAQSTISENKFEAEEKVDEKSIKLDDPLESDLQESTKDGESPRDVPEQDLVLGKNDEVAKKFVASVSEPDVITDYPTKGHSEEGLQADDKVILNGQIAQVASNVETVEGTVTESIPETVVAEPYVKTTLQDLMKEESVSEATPDPVDESNAKQIHSSALPADDENEFKKSEPTANESGEVIKESAIIDKSTSNNTSSNVDKPKTEEESSLSGVAKIENPEVPEERHLKVVEATEATKITLEMTEDDKKVSQETIERGIEDENVESRDVNPGDSVNHAATGEATKQDASIKAFQRQSNILSKVKKSIVKVKKVITGKSPSSKSPSNHEVKVKQ